MRIIFVNRFFFPDLSATSQLLTDLAVHLAREGHSVSVVTSRLRYDDPSERLKPSEAHEGVDIRRVWTSRLGRARLLGRIADYATFYASALWTLLRLADPHDVIVAKTDPPLFGVPATLVARWRGASVVHWCQDLYPETAEAFGIIPKDHVVTRLIRRLRNWSFRHAQTCVVLGEGMAQRVAGQGAPPDAVKIIPNWVDETAIRPLEHAQNPLRRAWELDDRFVVAYSGNLGRAHEFDTLLAAAETLRDDPRIVFLFIGAGHGTERLRSAVEARGLQAAFQFRPYQDRENLDQSLGVADVHWVSLRPDLEGLIVPSKVYGVLAAGRPLIAVADPEGEVGRIVRDHACGLCVPPGDGRGLAAAIMALRDDPSLAAAFGQRGRALAESIFSRQNALSRWSDVLDGLQHDRGR